jgi:hypothetical protein
MNKLLKLVLIIIFLVILSLPYLTSLLLPANLSTSERRTLSAFPKLTWANKSTWASQITAHFNDHFGFRGQLLHYFENIKLNLIGSNLIYRSVVKNGWVMDAGPETFKTYYSSIFLPAEKLEKIKTNLEVESNYLKSKNIPYILVLTPSKHTIYPEIYPFPKSDTSYLSAKYILDYLNQNTNIEIIDLAKELPKFKNPNLPLFYRTDGHWTNYGAFAGYYATLIRAQKLNPKFSRLETSDFEITPQIFNIWQGDNALRALENRRPTDVGVKMTLKPMVNKKNPGTVLAIGDSFMHITRGVPKSTIDHPSFPQTRQKLGIFFQNPQIAPNELLVPKLSLDELIPLIEKEISDPQEANRLISYLKTVGVKNDSLEGLGYFLTLNFEKVKFIQNLYPLDLKSIDQEKPVLVIRQSQQNGLPNLVFEKN